MKATKTDRDRIGRLKNRADFLRVQATGVKWVSNTVIVQTAPAKADLGRFGLTVSKQVDKRAVIRNRARRRLRSAAYDVLAPLVKPGNDFVLIGRQGTVDCEYDVLCRDLKWCLKKMDLLA